MQTDFDVNNWLRADGPRALKVCQPLQQSCWSKQSITQGSGYLYGDASGLGYFSEPALPADLNEGYPECYIKKPEEESTPVEVIIEAAQHAAGRHINKLLDQARVVTFRNNLNKICGTPVNIKDAWTVDACLQGQTLFLDIVKSGGSDRSFPDSDRFTYYGYKFEQLCTSPTGQHHDHGRPPLVDSTSEYATLVKLKLGPHVILMAAEVDCADPDMLHDSEEGSLAPLASYMELKTYKLPEHPGQVRNLLAAKYPRWWLQSFLAGVPTLVLGGRDKEGRLIEVKRLPVCTLPSTAAAGGARWDAWQMLRFGEDLLTWMIAHAEAKPGQHLRFQYTPGPRAAVTCSVVRDGSLPGRLQSAVG